jgi:hypothetical protein
MLWGAMGLGVGLLAGFALAEVMGGRSALRRHGPEERLPGEQEGEAPAEGHADLILADQSA